MPRQLSGRDFEGDILITTIDNSKATAISEEWIWLKSEADDAEGDTLTAVYESS